MQSVLAASSQKLQVPSTFCTLLEIRGTITDNEAMEERAGEDQMGQMHIIQLYFGMAMHEKRQWSFDRRE